jgi:hypothetical protein
VAGGACRGSGGRFAQRWAEQRIRRALDAPGFASVGRDNGRKLWAMTEPGRPDEPVTPPAVIRVACPHIPGTEGEAP